MKAQVLTTITSASRASAVSVWPACSESPSMTSESTRFFGQPREMRPSFIGFRNLLRIQSVQHPRIRNRFPYVLQPADPADDTLDAHAETAVRHRAVFAEIEVPLERLARQLVLVDPLQQQIVVVQSLTPAADFAVP